MPSHIHDVYGSLLNNGMSASQPQCQMSMDVLKYSLNCHFGLVHCVYFQSPQVAYVDLCLGHDLICDEFKQFFFTGIHTAQFPRSIVLNCDVVFRPLAEQVLPDQIYSLAMAIAEDKQLPAPLIAPYTGFRQCLLDPLKTKPKDFFSTLFDDNIHNG